MVPTIPLETKRRLHKGPAIGAIPICFDGHKPVYLGVAIECGLVPNLDGAWQNGTSYIVHSVISSYTNPNKSNMERGVLPRNKIDMAFCLTVGVAQMGNELLESLATAYRT